MTVETPTGRFPAGEERISPAAGGAETAAPRPGGGRLGAAAAGLIGMAVVWYVFGGHILPPSHTGWMLTGTIGPDPV